MKRAIFCALISAAVGYAIAVYVGKLSPSDAPWMSAPIAYILCPPGILAGLTMTDPDNQSLWLLFGPLNAILYGWVGFAVWRRLHRTRNQDRD